RGVGRDDRLLGDDPVELLQELALQVEVLGRALDHALAALELLERDEPAVDALLAPVLEEHLVAGLRSDLREPLAHRAGADDAERVLVLAHQTSSTASD